MNILEPAGIVFGRHAFDPERCELRSDGGPPVPLGQRAGRLLHALLEESGRVLSRDDLLQRAWPGQDIPDGNLRVQIAALRRALAQDRELIGTVAGRGYLFAGRIERRGGIRPHLPQPPAACVGRAELVDDVLARCADTRFITLAGAAGIGKTALALAAAHRQPGPVAWAELAGLDGAAREHDLVPAIFTALGLRPDAADGWTPAALAARLREQALLLVLDNCEHVADACSRLVETLLRHCPRLAVLATSRQPLLAQGETVVRVPALALPAPDETDAARLAASSAVTLFVQRARSADLAFVVDRDTLALAATVCRRLDGLPLAIELAAAQVATLGLRQVADGLDDRLAMLLGGREQGYLRRATPRHRTLRAALDWSYVLLPAPAQQALLHVARFPSWFTLDDAVALLAPVQSPYDTIDSLASLAAHSLLVVDQSSRPARYRLLATTRAYATSLASPHDR